MVRTHEWGWRYARGNSSGVAQVLDRQARETLDPLQRFDHALKRVEEAVGQRELSKGGEELSRVSSLQS